MARPKEFNRQEALGKAMDVFWTHGYEATTMTTLREAMGLARQSLYDTFGDKDQLFAEALARYISFNDGNLEALLGGDAGLDGIHALFDSRVEMLSAPDRRGCLMMNSCIELAAHYRGVAKQLNEGLSSMEQRIAHALTVAQERGSLSSDIDVAEVATFFVAQIAGMVVIARTGASKERLRAVADCALQILT